MGQVRGHIKADDAALAQWVYRKCKNHDPMKIRDTANNTAGKVSARGYMVPDKSASQRSHHVEGETTCVYEMNSGKRFKITVEELA